ncbi:MAG: DUF805 domain-containing protein [Candidatus Korobacteraceae bacterium]|jgi:uncharacterized membrane protein YhaH (DUF805 family)
MYWYLEVMRKYAVFTGRATRTEYWMFQLVNFVIVLLVTAVTTAGILMQPRTQRPGFWVPFFLAFGGYILATIIPGLAVSVRRLHDTDLSGWWLFISLVPLGGIVLFVFHVLDGTPGPNRYGPNPKGVTSSAGQYAPYQSLAMAQAAANAAKAQPTIRAFQGFCTNCGTGLVPGSRFCMSCGKEAN